MKHFSLIVASDEFDAPVTDDQLLDATDALGETGCTDCSVMAHDDGLELAFHRQAESLDAALSTALRDVRSTGLSVVRVELNQHEIAESVPVAT